MNLAYLYNAMLTAGTAAVGVGAGAQWGWPVGLMASGGMVIALTFAAVSLVRGAPRGR